MFKISLYFQKHEMFGNELADDPMAETVLSTSDRMFEEIGYKWLCISTYMV